MIPKPKIKAKIPALVTVNDKKIVSNKNITPKRTFTPFYLQVKIKK